MDHRRRTIAASLALDLALVMVFAALGSRSHDGRGLGDVVMIAAPFAVGTVLGWFLSTSARTAPTSVRTGVDVWIATLAIGVIARRFVFGRGTALPFVIIAAVVLAAFVIGWRWIRASSVRRRAVRSARPPSRAER